MYEEDNLYEPAVDFLDVSDVSIDETSSMDTIERNQKKRNELFKRTDVDFYSYKTVRLNEDGDRTIHRTQIYSSRFGRKIRNAPSGVRENALVGTRDESSYFVVKDVGLYTKTEYNQEPRKLFYNTPEECERHLNVTISQPVKEAWHKQQLGIR